MKKSLILFLFLFLGISCLFAQQSSKSKAAKKLYEKGNKIKLINAGSINSPHLEFSPTFYQDGIVFATSRKAEAPNGKNYFELFYSDRDEKGLPIKSEDFFLRIDGQAHEGPVTFSRDGQEIFFTRKKPKAETKGSSLKIYQATRTRNDWNSVKELSFNSDAYSNCHPSISTDGQRLYFSSDMPGGMGGTDIWMVEKRGITWSKPINLGPEVNTPKNEVYPFIHNSGNLFFSSNGFNGAGGLDIYMVNFDVGPSGTVVNLGEPFNTEADDLGLILNPEGIKGFFTSKRASGKGNDDIYMFEAPEGIWGKTVPGMLPAGISLTEKGTGDPIEGAEIRIFEKTADGYFDNRAELYEGVLSPDQKKKGTYTFKMVPKAASAFGPADGRSDEMGETSYQFFGEREYVLFISKPGYVNQEVAYSTIGYKKSVPIKVHLEKVACSVISGTIRDQETGEPIPDAMINILNENDGSEAVIQADGAGNYSHCLMTNANYTFRGIHANYSGEALKLTPAETATAPTDLLLNAAKENHYGGVPMEVGTVIRISNIKYDFSKSGIRRGAVAELDELLNMLSENPTMKIELSAHTDARGSNRYNERLSNQRAASAKQYLVARGIAAKRITAVGYGENQLLNGCRDKVKCSDTQHAENRRLEIKVVGQ